MHPPFKLHKPRLRQDGLAFYFISSCAGIPCRVYPHPLTAPVYCCDAGRVIGVMCDLRLFEHYHEEHLFAVIRFDYQRTVGCTNDS